ncbi:MAG: hypothetical protein ABIH69_02640, partial [bacterium]
HDIGKVLENNSIWTKAMLVLIRFFLPPLYDYLADIGQNKPLLRRFYIHKHHGAEGAKLLEKIGETSDILAMIAKHDPRSNPLDVATPLELKLLIEADCNY